MLESEAVTDARARYKAALRAKMEAEQEAENAGWSLRQLEKEEANGVRH